MNKATQAGAELLEMDAMSAGDSPLHRIHPLAKLAAVIFYIAVTVSFPKYDLSGLSVMVLFPVFLYQLGGISLGVCFYKLRYVLPLVMAVGIVNPFLDTRPMVQIGGLTLSGGVISMITLMLKGIFSLMASFLLMSTTRMDQLCAGLRKIHVPEILVTLLLLTYRYITVMVEQVSIMSEAYALRAPGQKGIHFSAWGSFLGQLLLRSMDKATELYQSMLQRGFDGSFRYASGLPFRVSDWIFTAVSLLLLLTVRFLNIAGMLGALFV